MCKRQYNDDMRFCLEDGSSLVTIRDDRPEVETQFARAPTVASGRSRTFSYLIAAALFVVGGIFLIAAVTAGYLIYRARGEENVFIEPTSPTLSPTPKPTLSPVSDDPTKTPESRRTPEPGPTKTPQVAPPTPDEEIIKSDDVSRDEDPRSGRFPKRISGGVLNGKATSLPKPAYPPAARAVRAQGAVTVQVLVDEEGNVANASAVSGHPLLRASAVQAARAAKFSPTKLSGRPVKVSGILTYNFTP